MGIGHLMSSHSLSAGHVPLGLGRDKAIEELENFEKGIKPDILNHFLLYFINFSIISNTFFYFRPTSNWCWANYNTFLSHILIPN